MVKSEPHILIIDDDEVITQLLSTAVECHGYHVSTFNESPKAMAFYRANHKDVDVVVLDFVMPEMSGSECYNEIIKQNPDAKIIISSGLYKEDIIVTDIRRMEDVPFMKKPINIKDFINTIGQLCIGSSNA